MPPENIYGRPIVENVVFNFDDIITGRTYIPFYCFGHHDLTTERFALTRQIITSDPTRIASITTFDQDFDLLVNRPITIEGDVLIEYNYGSTGGGSGAARAYNITFTLRKWDGSTETDLGSQQGRNNSRTGDFSQKSIVKFTVNKTTFAIGETIRLTAVGIGGAASRLVFLGINPSDSTDECIMYLPTLTQE